jgi:hypothetical protein
MDDWLYTSRRARRARWSRTHQHERHVGVGPRCGAELQRRRGSARNSRCSGRSPSLILHTHDPRMLPNAHDPTPATNRRCRHGATMADNGLLSQVCFLGHRKGWLASWGFRVPQLGIRIYTRSPSRDGGYATGEVGAVVGVSWIRGMGDSGGRSRPSYQPLRANGSAHGERQICGPQMPESRVASRGVRWEKRNNISAGVELRLSCEVYLSVLGWHGAVTTRAGPRDSGARGVNARGDW